MNLLLSSAVGTCAAQTTAPDELGPQVDALFASWDRPDSPGCAVAVVHDGAVVYKRGYGSAHLEHDIPITPETVFNIASVTKQFTAMSVALLAEAGTLSLDDDIRTYLPEMPVYERPITIRHLIHHTSGIRGYFALWYLAGKEMRDTVPDEEVFDLLRRQKALNFTPGDEQSYSNSGYFLLAEIVRRVSGTSLRDVAREHLFDPLGMRQTQYRDDQEGIIKNRAESYHLREDSTLGWISLKSNIVGEGGIYSTVEDLARWDQNFYQNKLGTGGPALIDTLLTRGVLNDGDTIDYAFGLAHGTYRGLEMVTHGGTMAGYRSQMVRFPAQRFTAIVLCNQLEISPFQLTRRLADLYLADELRGPVPAPGRIGPAPVAEADKLPVGPERLALYVGDYYNDELPVTHNVSSEEGRLVIQIGYHPPHRPDSVGEDTFREGGIEWTFQRDDQGRVVGYTIRTGRVEALVFVKR